MMRMQRRKKTVWKKQLKWEQLDDEHKIRR